MYEQMSDVPEKKGILQKIGIKKSTETPFTAEKCWVQTRYGEDTYKVPVERVEDKQRLIRETIESKFSPSPNSTTKHYNSYHCVINIEEDLMLYVDEILQPFRDGGFEIVDLTKYCKDVTSEGVYIISWKNAFESKKVKEVN